MNGLQKKIILKALDWLEDLTDWERTFINDLAGKPDTYTLSAAQNHQLNRIWEKLE